MFPLKIRTLEAQDNFGTSEDGLLSEYVLDALANLLGCGDGVGSVANNQEQLLNTLFILSPLPIIHHDPQHLEGKQENALIHSYSCIFISYFYFVIFFLYVHLHLSSQAFLYSNFLIF